MLKNARLKYAWLVMAMSAMACGGGAGGFGMSCGGPAPSNTAAPAPSISTHTPIGQLPAIDIQQLLAHTRKLSSDEFEGRLPGTKGEQLTVAYLVDQFKAAGLEPGNPDGTWVQKVPLVGLTPQFSAPLVVSPVVPAATDRASARAAAASLADRCRTPPP
jgi:hypothetical protein